MPDEPKKLNVVEQLRELKALTTLTSVIHDLQVIQIRNWGMLFFAGEFQIELATEQKYIIYSGTLDAGDNEEKKMIALSDWIKHILGDDWGTRVFNGTKMVFDRRALPVDQVKWNLAPDKGNVNVGARVIKAPEVDPNVPTYTYIGTKCRTKTRKKTAKKPRLQKLYPKKKKRLTRR